MEKIKRYFASARGMQLVNILFLLAIIARHNGTMIVACCVWMVYLRYCIRQTSSPVAKLFFKGFMVFACVLILLNIYSLVIS